MLWMYGVSDGMGAFFFFFQAEDGIRDVAVTGVQTCALPISFLDELATRYRVYAPELPGYGESTGEELLEDMLDFALHGWDVVAALGLDRPHQIGRASCRERV